MSRILPILFNTEMTKAILDGRKTVTRRVVKTKAVNLYLAHGGNLCGTLEDNPIGDRIQIIKPSYQPGDILHVRETAMIQSMKAVGNKVKMLFVADDALAEFSVSDAEYERLSKWAHLQRFLSPYWLTKETSRIWLKVTDVRVERLQDITEEQARAEGYIDYHDKTGDGKFDDVLEFDLTARDAFVDLWNSTLKKDSEHTWAHNPWVWVISFERCEKPD